MQCPICRQYHRPLGDVYGVTVCQECFRAAFAEDERDVTDEAVEAAKEE